MKRPPSHTTDEKAQQQLIDALPMTWLKQKMSPDYGIDYEVEVAKARELTGLRFAVQLKGAAKRTFNTSKPSYAIKTSHLDYYLKNRMPVFLVVIQVQKKLGFWVFLQEYALTTLKHSSWRNQESVTIHLPRTNLLHNRKHLLKAVEEADKYMAALRPAAIPAAIAAREAHLESIDPRFRIEVKAENGRIYHTLHAKEPVPFNMRPAKASKEAGSKLIEAVRKGVPVIFAPGELDITGSGLFEEFIKSGGTLHISRTISAELEIASANPSAVSAAEVVRIPCTLEGGVSEVRVAASFKGSPFSLTWHVALDKKVPTPFTITFDPKIWAGRSLSALPYFEDTYKLTKLIGGKLSLTIRLEGIPNSVGETSIPPPELTGSWNTFMESMQRARDTAGHFQVDPTFPSQLEERHMEQIESLHHYVEHVHGPRPIRNMTVSTDIIPRRPDSFIEESRSEEAGNLKLSATGGEVPFWDRIVKIAPHEYIITAMTRVESDSELKSFLEKSSDGTVTISWRTTEASTCLIKEFSDAACT